jgi:hypothetical protein
MPNVQAPSGRYRARAEECRQISAIVENRDLKWRYKDLAAGYERLAEREEQLAAEQSAP